MLNQETNNKHTVILLSINRNIYKLTCPVSKPQIVQVVSILDVPIRFGSTSFQSNDVRGAQKSEFLFWNKFSYTVRPCKLYKVLKMVFLNIQIFWYVTVCHHWMSNSWCFIYTTTLQNVRNFAPKGRASHLQLFQLSRKDQIYHLPTEEQIRYETFNAHSHITYPLTSLTKALLANAVRMSNATSAIQEQRSVRGHVTADLIHSSSLCP